MGNLKNRLAWSRRERQAGFTLVELLVTVAIIVALAAAIIPNVSRFSGKGDEGAQAAELGAVQAAMDAMMAEQGIIAVTPSVSLAAPTSTWTALPVEATGGLAAFLRADSTNYTYCWTNTGVVSQTTANCP